MPVSVTPITTTDGEGRTDSVTAPPAAVNLTAFDNRFQIACCSRALSASTVHAAAGTDESSATPFAIAAGRIVSTLRRATSATSVAFNSSRSWPMTIRETSRRSLTICACVWAFR